MVRRGSQRAVVGRERLLLAAERAQRIAAIVERERMPRRDGKRRIVVGERRPGLVHRRAGVAAVDQRLHMARRLGQHGVEGRDGLGRPLQTRAARCRDC